MKKDVIYVDIEDDITSIIDKVKGAGAPIVALVPPKRIGVLQSVVNLKLLNRAASSADKRVVLITNDSALSSLAAGLSMPVAKNLQSKPEVPAITALEVDDEDVIDGQDLSIGELAATGPQPSDVKGLKVTDSSLDGKKPVAVVGAPAAARAAANAPVKGSKLPNFDSFRKKLFLSIGGGVFLIGFLVWALVFAPHATVTITAKTNIINISQVVQLRPGATLDTAQHVLPAVVEQTKKATTVDFEATGKKDVGEKASGTVRLSTDSISVARSNPTIPAGTVLTASNGKTYATNESVTLSLENSSDTTVITATGSGTAFNGASGDADGAPKGVNASITTATAGGTDKTVTVVSAADIEKAKEQFQTQDSNSVKDELKKQFESDEVIIEESFKADAGAPTSTPRVGEEATSKAKLTAETTFTLVGVKRSDLKSDFDDYLKAQLTGKEDQKIYASGDTDATFSQFKVIEGGYTATVAAEAQVGPEIDENTLKKQLVGKRAGEIQQQLTYIEGVENVETKFSPFWVTKAPKEDKITVKFLLKNESN